MAGNDKKPEGENHPHGCIHAFKMPAGAGLKNEIRIRRKIRVQILDTRSGQPLRGIEPSQVLLAPPGETLDPARHAAVRFERSDAWDIKANGVIRVGSNDKPLSRDGFTKKNTRQLQAALSALGYNCGRAGSAMTKQDWQAFQRFQDEWLDAHPDVARPAKFAAKIEDVWVDRVISEYNRHFHATVQTYLAAALDLDGTQDDPQSEQGKWDTLSEKALAIWQKQYLSTKKPWTSFSAIKSAAERAQLAEKLIATRKRYFTNDGGILHVPLTVDQIKKGFQLRVEFRDFPLIAEQSGFRDAPVIGATGFGIEWPNTPQDPAGRWGWRLRPPGDNSKRQALPEFHAYFETTVPPAPDLHWTSLSSADRLKARFSPHYGAAPANPEFVLFGLVWCQPVWDDIRDASPPKYFTGTSYVDPNGGDRGRFMHLVTRAVDFLGGTEPYGGKGYGKVEATREVSPGVFHVHGTSGITRWRSNNGHAGYDLQAVIGAPVFAMRGGSVRRRPDFPGSDGGNRIELTWLSAAVGVRQDGNDVRTSVTYLHLSAFDAADRARVKAGLILGRAGRTGNLGLISANPTHTHLNVGAHGYTTLLNSTPADPENLVAVPSNDTALLFPCACEVTASSSDPSGCRFQDPDFTKKCWAVAELVCPYMEAASGSVFRLQAQLRYLYEQHGSPFLNPGDPDGSAGTGTKRAVRAFREWAGLPEGDTMDEAAWQRLNAEAPVAAPDLDLGTPAPPTGAAGSTS